MNTKPFYTDQFNLHKLKTNVNRVRPLLSNIVDEFKKLEIEIISISEISDLLTPDSTRKLDEEKLTEFVFTKLHPTTPGGMDREKYKQLCTMPDLTALIESFEPLRSYQDAPHFRDLIYWTVYSIVEGKVEVIPEQLTEVCRPFQEFTESPNEEARLSLVNELCDLLNRIAKLTAPGEFAGSLAITNVCVYDNGKFSPAREFVKTGNTTGRILISSGRNTESLKSSPSKQKHNPDSEINEFAAMARNRNL